LLGGDIAPDSEGAIGLSSDGQPGFGLLCLGAGAVLGQLLAAGVGLLVRNRLTWRPLRNVDSVGGSVVSIVAVLLVGWGLAQVVTRTQYRTLTRAVAHSEVLTKVDDVLPGSADNLLAALLRLVDNTGFPRVFGGFGAEQIVPVAPPDPSVENQPGVKQAHDSVVKIEGVAPSCSRSVEGTGFVISPEHVVTNAHVVAGVTSPRVLTLNGQRLTATVVLYDPKTDLAVLDVPGLQADPLSFSTPAARGASGVVVGYPENGPFTVTPSRVRSREQIRGPDIYGDATVTREVLVLFAQVRPGNSGGPVLNAQGQVEGVVFAASTQDSSTGYALSAAQAQPDVTAGMAATAPVSTQGCD
jgi:S1-C subfamily serine protease